MIYLVNDANILIDLLKLNLLDIFLQLEYDFQVTDIVFSEIQEDNVDDLETFIDQNLLTRQSFSFEELIQIQRIAGNYPALSIADCSCLYLAEKQEAILLTGDGALRRIAEERAIPVHGMLWVFDELLAHGLISRPDAQGKLLQLMAFNQRLPKTECQYRLRIWKTHI